jgi:aerobic-type carbon monoxide dehydrogenase small subunit (CoxS/CutS family)
VGAKHLLDKNPNPTEEDARQALAGNICCCGTYPRHPTAILEAAEGMKRGA